MPSSVLTAAAATDMEAARGEGVAGAGTLKHFKKLVVRYRAATDEELALHGGSPSCLLPHDGFGCPGGAARWW